MCAHLHIYIYIYLMGLYHAFFYIYSNFDVDLQYVEREKNATF